MINRHFQLAGRFTTEVVADVIFGVKADALTDSPSEVLYRGKSFLGILTKVMGFFVWNGFFPWIKNLLKIEMMGSSDREFFRDLIRRSLDGRSSGGQRKDFLQFLHGLQEKNGLPLDTLLAYALTFYLDGDDTSSVAIARTLQEVRLGQWMEEILGSVLFSWPTILECSRSYGKRS